MINLFRASTQALQMLGLKPEKDASLILAIKEAVKKLGLITLLVNYKSCASGMAEVAIAKI